METRARATFKTSFFPIEPGEDEDINPGIFGKALATWLVDRLKERGVPVEALIEEDFARLVLIQRKPFMLWVGCASEDGSATDWQLLIAAELGIVGLLKRIDPSEQFRDLKEHVAEIVKEIPGVSSIEWHPQ